MRKNYLFLTLLCCLGVSHANAQNWIIPGCSITLGTTLYGPMYSVATANAASRKAVIYPVSSLGGLNGVLTNMYLERTTVSGTMAGTPNFKIYLKEVTASDWGSGSLAWATEIAGATLVFDGNPAPIVGSTDGWKNFPFTTNFPYLGSQNLAVFFEYSNTSPSTSISWTYEYGEPCIDDGNSNTTKYSNNTSGTLSPTLGSSNYRRPYIGFDFFVPPCTASPNPGTAIVSNSTPCAGDSVTLDLQGNDIGTGLTFQWQSAPSASGPWTSIGTPSSVPAANVLPPTATTTYYRAELICSSNTPVYSTPPVQVTVPALFPGGTYTIGGTSGPNNFATFADAASAISCGIAGPVILNVTSGTYTNDQFILGPMNNTAVNSVTVNGNGATMSFFSSNTNERAAILLNGTDHVSVNNLNIIATGSTTSQYGSGVWLTNDADSNTFTGLNITVDTTSTSTNYIPIVISGATDDPTFAGSDCDGNTFTGNILNGGYYGIMVYGNAATPYISDNVFNNNIIKNFYAYGFYLYRNHNTLIEGNDLSRPTRTNSTTFAGIYLGTASTGILFNANRIHNAFDEMPTSTSSAYPLYCVADATATDPIIFSNNLIYDINNNGTIYGAYNSGAAHNKYYHNTFSFDDLTATTSSATRGLYQTTNVQGVEFINNIVSIKRGGSGINYGIYKNTAATPLTANYNNYFIAGSGTNHIGYEGGSETTLADWQTASGQDLNSTDLPPLFSSATDYTPGNSGLDNTGTPVGVTTDIMNAARSATLPDMGAYEFAIPPCFGTPTAGIAYINGAATASGCTGSSLTLTLQGFSTGAGLTIQWQSSPMGQFNWTDIPGATNPTYVTTFNGNMDYQAIVVCLGAQSPSNTVTATANPFYFCYCSPNTGVTLQSSTSNYVTNVEIPGTSLNSGLPMGAGGYTFADPTVANNTAVVAQGLPYTLDITQSGTSTSYNSEVWIDWDRDGLFETSEYYLPTESGNMATITFTPPVSAGLGMTGLRIRTVYSSSAHFGDAGACDNISIGRETEDYVITVVGPQTCFAPSNVTAPVVSFNTATIDWTASGTPPASGYDYYVSTVNTNPSPTVTPTGSVGAGVLTATLSGLTPATPYYVWVRGDCGGTDYSIWSGPLDFTTACAPFTAPYTHDVETQLANTSSTMTDCWMSNPSASSVFAWHVTDDGTTGSANTGPNNAHSGNNYFFTEASNGSAGDVAVLTTPIVDVAGLSAPMLEFWYHMFGASISKMVVEVFDGTTWNPVDSLIGEQQTSETAPWLSRGISLPGYTGPIQARFIVTRGSALTGDVSIDDISIMQTPTCLPPANVTVNYAAATTATLNWTASTTAPGVGYDFYYNTTNTAPTGTTTPTSTAGPTATTATLSGLTPTTTYYLWVRTNCAVSDQSTWTGPLVFATACVPVAAPFLESFDATTTPACWTNTGVENWEFSTTATYGAGSTEHTGNSGNYAWVDDSAPNNVGTTLESPIIDISGLTNPRLRFYIWSNNTDNSYNDTLIIQAFNGTAWVTLDSISQNFGAQWQELSYYLSSLGATTIQFRFIVNESAGNSYYHDISIDDVYVENGPLCPQPTNLSVSATTATGTTLGWSENGSATQWTVEFGPQGFTPGSGTFVAVTATPAMTLSALTPGTPYEFYVRAICGASDSSIQSIAKSFATTPVNDLCMNATDITDGQVYTGTTAGGTETMSPCDATTASANDVWYSFTTGSVGGTVTVTVITTGTMDVVIQGFSGNCGSLTGMVPTASTTLTGTCIDGPAAGTEFGDFTVAPNTTYYIRVYGFNSLQGTFTIQAVGTPLAIKLESIKAVNVGSRNRVDWITASEDVGDRFELERSADGKNFTVLSTIDAKGLASSYSYWDEQPFSGVNYYRLKMADPRGNTSYSQVVTATMNVTGVFAVEAFPNPVTDVLTVRVHGTSASDGSASLYDATGKLVRTVNLTNNEATINMTGLSSGVYLLNYSDSNHRKSTRITKQ